MHACQQIGELYQVILAAFIRDFWATLFTNSPLPVAGAAHSSTSPARGGSFSGSAGSRGPVTYLRIGTSESCSAAACGRMVRWRCRSLPQNAGV